MQQLTDLNTTPEDYEPSPPSALKEENLDLSQDFKNLFDPQITATLENIELRLKRILSLTQEARKKERHSNIPGHQPLHVTYARSLANALYKLELLLYEYSSNSRQRYTSFGKHLADTEEEGVCSIQIHVHEDRVMFRMPHLPQRSYKHDLVNIALTSKIYTVYNYPKWGHVTMEFCHVYPKSVHWMPCDNDNYLYKRTIDLICSAMRLSDSPATMDLVKRTVFTDKLPSGTYITITPKSSEFTKIPEWRD